MKTIKPKFEPIFKPQPKVLRGAGISVNKQGQTTSIKIR